MKGEETMFNSTFSPSKARLAPVGMQVINLAELEQVEGGCLFCAIVAVAPAAIPIAIAIGAVCLIYWAVS